MRALLHVEDEDAIATVFRAAIDEAAIDVSVFSRLGRRAGIRISSW